MTNGTSEAVSKTATCRKCGSTSVAWVTSHRTGRNYLVETTSDGHGGTLAHRTQFHSRQCEENLRMQAAADITGKHLVEWRTMSTDDLERKVEDEMNTIYEIRAYTSNPLATRIPEKTLREIVNELRRRGVPQYLSSVWN